MFKYLNNCPVISAMSHTESLRSKRKDVIKILMFIIIIIIIMKSCKITDPNLYNA